MATDATEAVQLYEFVMECIEARLLDVHTSLPVQVESFDASKQTVEVTIQINRMISDGATPPNWVSEQMPKLKDIPVGFMRGGGFFVSFPLQQGDPGMLLMSERPLGAWRSTGTQGDPGDLGMHTLDGAYFVPCVAPNKAKLTNADANNMVIGSDTQANARIVIKPSGEIDAGANATNFVAMADKVKAWFDAFNTAVSGWTPVSNDGGAALKVALNTLIGGVPSTDPSSGNLKASD